jgi:hypothetical protein
MPEETKKEETVEPTPPETQPEPEKVAAEPETVAHKAEPQNDLAETVRAIDARVSELADAVRSVLPENRDETPVRRPWTHKRFF